MDAHTLEPDADELGGELITQADLAEQVAEDWDQESPMVRALFDDLVRGEQAKAVLAEAQARRLAEFHRDVEHARRNINGLGQVVASIPLSVYLHWSSVYGHEFWAQDDSLDFILNRAGGGAGNPGLRVHTPRKPQVTVDRTLGSAEGEETKPAGAAKCRPAGPRARRGRWAS